MLWVGDLIVMVVLLATSEAMFRVGRVHRFREDVQVRSQITTAQASMLGLLALMLGFTMSMAESRFDARRRIVLDEAAAVGTTYLRAELLPEPVRTRSRGLLREYVDARRTFFHANHQEAPAATARAHAIHRELWAGVVSLAPTHETSDMLALYAASLNDMIDLEAMRDVAVMARLPETVHMLVIMCALVAVALTGFASGVSGKRVGLVVWLLPVLIACAYAIIMDLDRSREGLISTGDMPMRRLEQLLRAER
jgi:hypothetical protein